MSWIKKDMVALDWDHRQVRLVRATASGGRLDVKRMFHVPVPAGVVVDEPNSFGSWLAGVLATHQCGGLAALMAVPRDQVVLKTLVLPPTPREELAAAVQFQMQKELPFAAEQAVIEYTVGRRLAAADDGAGPPGRGAPPGSAGAGRGESRGGPVGGSEGRQAEGGAGGAAGGGRPLEVLVAATRIEVIDYYRRVAELAGLSLRRIGLRCLCNVQAIRACTPGRQDDRLLAVNVGPELTEIDILRGSNLLFSRAASVELGDQPDEDFFSRLSLEVMRSVQAARATMADLELDGVVVAAQTSLAAPIARRLGEELAVPSWMLEPGKAISLPREGGEGAGEASAALGLCLGELKGAELKFDFLHPHRPVDIAAQRKKKRLLIASAAVAALIAAFSVNQVLLMVKDDRLRDRNIALADLNRRVGDLRKNNEALAGSNRTVANIIEAERAAPVMLDELKKLNEAWVGNPAWHKDANLARFEANADEDGWRIALHVLARDKELLNQMNRQLRLMYDPDKRPGLAVNDTPASPVGDECSFTLTVEYKRPKDGAKK